MFYDELGCQVGHKNIYIFYSAIQSYSRQKGWFSDYVLQF